MNIIDLGDERNRILGKLLLSHAESIGDSPFLISDEQVYSYGQANSIVNAYASGLRRLGIKAGDRLVIYMHSCVEFVLLTLAASKLGAVWVPINTDYKGVWLVDAINASRGSLLVTDSSLLPRIQQAENQLHYGQLLLRIRPEDEGNGDLKSAGISLDELADNPDDEPDMSRIRYGDTVAVLWTSGTTGKPKGVMQSHNVWIHAGLNNNRLYQTGEGDITYNCFPMYNSAAWSANIYRSLAAGIPCALDEHFSVTKFWDRIRFYNATQTMTIGAMHMFLWNEPRKDNDADNPLRIACVMPLQQDLITPFCERFGIEGIVQGYGQSEALLVHSKLESPKVQYKPNALGTLCAGIELKLLDDNGQEVGPGEVGEFSVKPTAPHVIFNGYFDDPEATKKAYRGEWFCSGDLGMQDAEGNYFFVDRKKDYIRYKGRNVSSMQVEGVARMHPAVQAVAVYGVPSEVLASEAEIKLDAILKPGQQVLPEDIARFINDHAPYFCVPRYIEIVDELPYTPTQKIEKYKLRARGVTSAAWDRLKSDFQLDR